MNAAAEEKIAHVEAVTEIALGPSRRTNPEEEVSLVHRIQRECDVVGVDFEKGGLFRLVRVKLGTHLHEAEEGKAIDLAAILAEPHHATVGSYVVFALVNEGMDQDTIAATLKIRNETGAVVPLPMVSFNPAVAGLSSVVERNVPKPALEAETDEDVVSTGPVGDPDLEVVGGRTLAEWRADAAARTAELRKADQKDRNKNAVKARAVDLETKELTGDREVVLGVATAESLLQLLEGAIVPDVVRYGIARELEASLSGSPLPGLDSPPLVENAPGAKQDPVSAGEPKPANEPKPGDEITFVLSAVVLDELLFAVQMRRERILDPIDAVLPVLLAALGRASNEAPIKEASTTVGPSGPALQNKSKP